MNTNRLDPAKLHVGANHNFRPGDYIEFDPLLLLNLNWWQRMRYRFQAWRTGRVLHRYTVDHVETMFIEKGM